MITKRQILANLNTTELKILVDYFHLEVDDRRKKRSLVDGLVASKSVRIEEVLWEQPLAALKNLCVSLDVTCSSGQSREALINKLLSSTTYYTPWRAPLKAVEENSIKPLNLKRKKKTVADDPKLLAEWHWEKNEGLKPEDVLRYSNKTVWWRCSEDPTHEWQTSVDNRAEGSSCPMCRKKPKKVPKERSLAFLEPEVAAEWHPEKNGDLTPEYVTPGSIAKVWWRCSKFPEHEWQATVLNRTHGRKCPTCSGKRVTQWNRLSTLRPDLAAEWHPEKNGDLTPDKVTPRSPPKVWWRCSKDPSHEWQEYIRFRAAGRNCPFCYGPPVRKRRKKTTKK